MPKRPTLGSVDCLLQLCPELLKACHLEPDVLAKYLDPYYCPPSKFARGQANTVMAQYHRQHALPEASLARGGILGNPFRDNHLSGAEIAMIHCCREPLFMPQSDEQLMLFIGNSLSVLLACLPLALAASSLQPAGSKVDPLQAVQWAVGTSQIAVVPLRDGYVLCKQEQVQEAMSRLRPAVPWGQMPLSGFVGMQMVWVQDDSDSVAILKSPGFSLPHVLDSFNIQFDECNLHEIQQSCHLIFSCP